MNVSVLDARAEPHAAMPTITLPLHVVHDTPLLGALLRVQVRIEAPRRRYSDREAEAISELFGPRERWKETMRPLLWTTLAMTVPAFHKETTTNLSLTCSYDFEVGPARYLAALEDGVIPLTLLFSGHLFEAGPRGLSVTPVAWDREASFALPVETMRASMRACFGDDVWIRVSRETFDELARYKREQGLRTWDEVVR